MTAQDNPGLIVSRAIQVTRSEPCGPVYLSFPKELTLERIDKARFPSADQLGIPRPTAPDADAIAEIAERLARAENPVAVVSGSGRNSATVPALVELAELLGLAVVDSAQKAYMCFPFRHPLYQAQPALADADVVLVLEADVPWVPGRNSPREHAYIAAVGIDPIKLRIPTYEFTAEVVVAADSLLTIRALTAAAESLLKPADRDRIAARSARLTEASRARIEAADQDAIARSGTTPIDPLWLSYNVGQLLDDNCMLLDDTLGRNQASGFMPCNRPGSYFANPGSSGGWAPGAALGAKLAAPDRDVIAITGDGFYMFGTPAPAIWAASHHDAPFMCVVYTNRSYTTGTTRIVGSYGADSYAAKGGFEGGYFDPPIDFAKEAEAAGAYGENVRDPADVAPALARGLEQVRGGTPAVISVWLKRLEGDD
jgi:acetolactate synthase-1/2/3 large subunit